MRQYCRTHTAPDEYVRKCEERSSETVANIMLTLIHQLDAMLARVLKGLEGQFMKEGGLKEAMTRARKKTRGY